MSTVGPSMPAIASHAKRRSWGLSSLATCAELGVTFVAYSPLGRGFLTGAIRSVDDLSPDDYRRQSPRFQGENFAKNLELVHKVEELARERRITPAQLALAWVLSRGDHVVAIPGTRSAARVDENAAAARIELTQAELDALDAFFPPGRRRRHALPGSAARLLNA